jgi:predicted small lipoprotein YifL
MNRFKKLFLILAAAAVSLSLGACEKKGPFEKAGEKIDKAGEKAGDKIRDVTK